MKTLKIKKGWFYGAGSIYGWKDDGYNIWGVGIDRKYFNEPEVNIEIEGEKYKLDTKKGREFINKYKSHKVMKSAHVGVVSKDLLEKVEKKKTDFDRDIEWFDNL